MNGPVHHIEGQEVKQHDYATSSLSDEGLHHHNTTKMFNFVRATIMNHVMRLKPELHC